MKVTAQVKTPQAIEVEVSVFDVMRAVRALGEADSLDSVIECVQNCYLILGRITDEQIGTMSPQFRTCVAERLRKQAGRFAG